MSVKGKTTCYGKSLGRCVWTPTRGFTNNKALMPDIKVLDNVNDDLFGRGYNTDDFQSHLYDNKFLNIRPTQLKKVRLYPQEKHKRGYRKTMFANLPWYYKGACGIKPNDYDLASMIDGAKHRVGGVTPMVNKKTLAQFKRFCASWFKTNLTPLEWDTDVTVEKWLQESPYTMDRKAELLDEYYTWRDELNATKPPNFAKLESFIKDEFYMEPKTFRTINSRIELFKCLVGPIVHAVEKEVFKLPYFIKKVPVAERAQYIMDNLYVPGNVYSGSDASNWEGSMNKQIMNAVEVPMFRYMTQNLPTHNAFMTLYSRLLMTNQLCFSGFYCEVLSRRMSGEMSTSVGNGLTNLLEILFTATKMKLDIKVVVEGDDALVSSSTALVDKYFKKLGFNYVLQRFDELSEASFCGLIFSDTKHTIRDPVKCLLKLGWCTQQYITANRMTKMQLLRAKALSLKCEMPDCPILGPLADRIIELTNHINIRKSIAVYVRNLSLYARNEFLDLISNYTPIWKKESNVTSESRVLMEKLYGIDIDAQIALEHDFKTMPLGGYSHDVFDLFIPRDNRMFWDVYIKSTPFADYNDTLINVRVSFYQTYLPANNPADNRKVMPSYAVGVGT